MDELKNLKKLLILEMKVTNMKENDMKEVESCGVLIKSDDKFLLCLPTNGYKWGIPKGLRDGNESQKSCAVRETYEETGIELDESDLKSPPIKVRYNTVDNVGPVIKNLFIFKYFDPTGDLQKKNLQCITMIDDSDEPEVCDYSWFTYEECKKNCMKSISSLFP